MNAGRLRSSAALLACAFAGTALPDGLPDIPGYVTLGCDFHMHTVFSDGDVWPTMRVAEARDEGLDCIAITDHLKYGKPGNKPEVRAGRNRSYEIAADAARDSGLVVIRGAEITQGMPPGHINAVFLADADIAQEDYMDTLAAARDQGAFLFWNHPSWKSPDAKWQQDGIAQWFDVHEHLVADGTLRGIEVVNGRTYSREAHRWAVERGLTIFGNSDVHDLVALEYGDGEHRPQTLVFATGRSPAAIRAALFDARTAVRYGDSLIGDARYLDPLFHACVRPAETRYLEHLAVTVVENRCDVDFVAVNTGEHTLLNGTRVFEFPANAKRPLIVRTREVLDRFALSVTILNLHTTPDDSLETALVFETSGTIQDKKLLDGLYDGG